MGFLRVLIRKRFQLINLELVFIINVNDGRLVLRVRDEEVIFKIFDVMDTLLNKMTLTTFLMTWLL